MILSLISIIIVYVNCVEQTLRQYSARGDDTVEFYLLSLP